ncbi:hypothetical protein J6590_106080 [Homalodisca vitripennis]|nr:hypothetical protein J6590_106080 [Homalodisca vitripennis]
MAYPSGKSVKNGWLFSHHYPPLGIKRWDLPHVETCHVDKISMSTSEIWSGPLQVVGTLSLSHRTTSPVLKTESDSKKKLQEGNLDEKYNVYSEFNNVNINIDLEISPKAVQCAQCSSEETEIRNPSKIGFTSKLEIFSKTCKFSLHFMSSP